MPFDIKRAKLISIICGLELEERIAGELMRAGATGYTVTRTRGRGRHGIRKVAVDDGGSIRIDVLVPVGDLPKLVEVMSHLRDDAITAYMQDVEAFPRQARTIETIAR